MSLRSNYKVLCTLSNSALFANVCIAIMYVFMTSSWAYTSKGSKMDLTQQAYLGPIIDAIMTSIRKFSIDALEKSGSIYFNLLNTDGS